MKDILARYKPENVFNCDETGLFWQMLPKKSLGFIGEQRRGKKPARKETIKDTHSCVGSYEMDFMLAMKSSWNMVKGETIANCWRKAGFVQDGECNEQVAAESVDEVETCDRNVWDHLAEIVGNLPTFDDYVDVDNKVESHNTLTDEEIVSQVTKLL